MIGAFVRSGRECDFKGLNLGGKFPNEGRVVALSALG